MSEGLYPGIEDYYLEIETYELVHKPTGLRQKLDPWAFFKVRDLISDHYDHKERVKKREN